MKRFIRGWVCACLAIALLLQSGCANYNKPDTTNNTNRVQMRNTGNVGDRLQTGQQPNTATNDAVIQLLQRDGKLYAPLRQLANTLEFNSNLDPNSGKFQIGDNDVAYELKDGSREATKGGEPLLLSSPVKSINGSSCVPVDDLHHLFGDAMSYKVNGDQLSIAPSNGVGQDDTGIPNYADDPNDLNRGSHTESGNRISTQSSNGFSALALKKVNFTKLISTAKRYMGVRYVFGSKPYSRTKTFDCSSFTQYVYGLNGVKLPRDSRQQSKVGTTVSRTSLRTGDLVFFYVPGRFKSNKTVGHVGIYMGSGKMINALPKGGVQITNMNSSYWKRTFLLAKRVAS